MVVPEFRSGDLREEFRDAVYSDNRLLEDEVKEGLQASELPLLTEGGKGKIHKTGGQEGRPFCGSSAKSYSTLLADEALDGSSSLCIRCFGPVVGDDDCQTLCSHTFVNENGEATRCGRRCVLSCEKVKGVDLRVHRCMMHARQD